MSTYTDASIIVTPNAYKAGKLYSLKPTDGSGDLGVVRATTATYVDADGVIQTALANEPRLDYTNGSCPSILIEPQRTNLLTYSEDFSNASWTSLSVNTSVSIDVVSSPNGLNTADLIIANALTSNSIFIRETIILPSTGIYTFSVYAKKQNQNIIGIRSLASGLLINYDLEAETSSTGFIDNVGGGWFRIGFSYSSSTINESIYIYPLGTGTRTGNGIDGVYVWGAQLEAGANATSYSPTVASSVTRNEDVISKTGISGITTITETFEDDTTNVISGSPTSYTMSQGRIKHVIGI